MWEFIKSIFTSIFTKEFWIETYPKDFPPECFDCRRSECKKCEFLNK
jgi:hypothetical protein